MKKGKIFFNVIIIITVTALVSIIGYAIYYYGSHYLALKEAEEAADEFEKKVIVVGLDEQNEIQEEPTVDTNETPTTNSNQTVYYRNYVTLGTIRIPKTNIKSVIVDKVTPSSISAAVAVLYGAGLNQVGNTVLVAHNYRDGSFFSNNKKLVNGDKIYITDITGLQVEYTIYKTYIASDMDFSYATRDTNGKREISLSTCTTDPTKRLVIWAKEQ